MLRQHVAALLGRDPADYRPAQMTYDLRRLRRKGFICRQAGSTRYELCQTADGHVALVFFSYWSQRPGSIPDVNPKVRGLLPTPRSGFVQPGRCSEPPPMGS